MQSLITRQDIYRLAAARDVFIRGYELYTKGAVREPASEYDAETDVETLDIAVAENGAVHRVKIFIKPPNAISGHMCRCTHHTVWRGACAHVIAALFCAADGTPNSAPVLSEKLVRAFEGIYLEEWEHDSFAGDAVTLYPQLFINYGAKPRIGFLIGRKKRYLLQDITALLNNIKHSVTVKYGRDLEFLHMTQAFDERSRRVISMINRVTENFSELLSYSSGSHVWRVGRHLPLTHEISDEFFEIYNGAQIEISIDDEEARSISVTDEPPNALISVDYDSNLPVLSAEQISFRTLDGHKRGYFIADKLHIVEPSFISTVAPLLRDIGKSDTRTLGVRPEDALRFHTAVLPVLQKFVAIKHAAEPPEGFSPPKVVAYLDCAKKTVVCRVIFRYGDTEINPLEKLHPDIPRDHILESRMAHFLVSAGFKADDSAYLLDNDDEVYEFYSKRLARLRELAEVYTTDEFDKKSYIPSTKAKIDVRIVGSLIEVDMSAFGYTSDELLAALEAWRVKKKYHRLIGGRFVEMETVNDAAEILDALEIGKTEFRSGVARLPMYRALYLSGILEHQKTAAADPAFNAMLTDFSGKLEYEIPAGLGDVLRPYQKTGYQWLRTLAAYGFGGILADEMGLGKTLQVIALIQATLEPGKPSVVVSPTSLVYNWEHEFQRFAPGIKALVITGMPEHRRELLRERSDVFITTYDMLKRDIGAYVGIQFKYVIADEAQYMKNPATQNATAVKELTADARFALTGTPIENSLTELWSVFDFIMPGYLFSLGKFSRVFETPIIKHDDDGQSYKLRKQIAPFVMRRMKKDVLLELPDKEETILYAGMENEQHKLYAAYLMQARDELDSASQMRILALLTRLRQICCHPALFAEGYDGGSGKLELAMDTIRSAVESGHRVLLFSQFTSMLEILTGRFDEAGLNYFYLDGQTTARERLAMANRFNSGECDVFAISLKAGGTGLNLTGADVVVHYDPWWNPAVMDQATDRAHRYGQDKTVTVINLVAKDSIEERILDLQAKKKGLIDSVIAEGGSFLSRMTVEEIRELFGE